MSSLSKITAAAVKVGEKIFTDTSQSKALQKADEFFGEEVQNFDAGYIKGGNFFKTHELPQQEKTDYIFEIQKKEGLYPQPKGITKYAVKVGDGEQIFESDVSHYHALQAADLAAGGKLPEDQPFESGYIKDGKFIAQNDPALSIDEIVGFVQEKHPPTVGKLDAFLEAVMYPNADELGEGFIPPANKTPPPLSSPARDPITDQLLETFRSSGKLPTRVRVDRTREARAREQGFDPGVFFHGTASEPFEAFDLGRAGLERGFFFSPDPRAAHRWKEQSVAGTGAEGHTMSVRLRLGNSKIVDAQGRPYSGSFVSGAIDDAKANGYDSLVILNMVDEDLRVGDDVRVPQVIVWDPGRIRRTDAEFNPEEFGSGRLLAGLAGGGIALVATEKAVRAENVERDKPGGVQRAGRSDNLEFDLEGPTPTGDENITDPAFDLPATTPAFDIEPETPDFELTDQPLSAPEMLVTTVDEAEEVTILPTSMNEFLGEIQRGVSISLNQIHEALIRTQRIGEETRRQLQQDLRRTFPAEVFGSGPEPDRVEDEIKTLQGLEQNLRDRIEQEIGAPAESITGAIARDMARLAVYAPIVGILTAGAGLGPVTATILGGTLASQLAYDADEGRLSDLLTEFDSPVLNNALTRALKYDEDDPEWVSKLKQAIEETILGAVTVGAFKFGGAATRTTARKARDMYQGTVALRRQEEATAAGIRPGKGSDQVSSLDHYSNSFRRDISEADAEIARAADEILRQDLDADNAMARFADAIEQISAKYSQPPPPGADPSIKSIRPFTRADVDRKLEVFQKRFNADITPPAADPVRVREIEDALVANDQAVAEAQKAASRTNLSNVRRQLREGIVDRSGTIKKEILDVGGPEAQRAVRNFVLAQGAPESARKAYTSASTRIFQDLSKSDSKALADIIRLRRFREIKSYEPDWEPPTTKAAGIRKTTAEDWELALLQKRRSMGEEQWQKINRAADDYFAEIIKPLDMLMESGVISPAERIALRRFQYSPIRFMEELDPAIATVDTGGRPVTVKSSGIKALSEGDKQLMLNDPQLFLAETIGRAHGRAFRNKANQGLYEFAEANPDNLTVRTTKPDEGSWTKISVMFDGEPRDMWLRSDHFEGWQLDPVAVPMWHRILSGSGLVRPLATGAFAPEFAMVNFFYDTQYAMMTAGSGKLFSPIFPKAIAQLGRDLAATAKDAFTRKGAFDAYIEQGGGMHLLTHQGFRAAERSQIPQLDSAWQAFKNYAGYVNESTELWVRLAIRNRVLRQRMAEKGIITPEDELDATFEARNYLDFSQGGATSKRVDAWVPYTNAAIQGFRGMARAVKESPVEMSLRLSQAGGVFASTWFANSLVNQEAWESVPEYVKASNLIITTPFFRTDREGNKRYMYFKIPTEHSVRPWKVFIEGMLDRSLTGKTPSNETLNILQQLTSVIPGVSNLPPTLNALITHGANFDWWRGEEVWRGDSDLPPTFERKLTGENKTSPLSMDIAEGVNPIFEALGAEDLRLSPERMDAAARALFPRSIWTDLVGAGYSQLTGQLDENIIERHSRSIQEGLAKDPFVRRFIGETHPFTRDVDGLRRAQEVASGEAFKRREEILRQLDTFKLETERLEPRQIKMIERWIKEQDPIYQPGLAKYLTQVVKLEETFDRIDPDSIPLTPSRTWWRWLSGAKPGARASAFWDEWSRNVLDLESSDAETRELATQRLRMMRDLMRNVPGFNPKTSQEFGLELYRMSRETGISLP